MTRWQGFVVFTLAPVSGTGTGSLIPLPSRERGILSVGLSCCDPRHTLPLWIADQVRNDGLTGLNDGSVVTGFYVLKVLIVSSPRWLMILMAMRRDAGTGNGRDTSLLTVSHVSRFIWAFKVVFRDL